MGNSHCLCMTTTYGTTDKHTFRYKDVHSLSPDGGMHEGGGHKATPTSQGGASSPPEAASPH